MTYKADALYARSDHIELAMYGYSDHISGITVMEIIEI